MLSDNSEKNFAIIKLDEPTAKNRWIVGTSPAVKKKSPFYSDHLQINHVKEPEKEAFFCKEQKHSHGFPIQEIYLVLNGTLKLEIENQIVTINSRELLIVPPGSIHQIERAGLDRDGDLANTLSDRIGRHVELKNGLSGGWRRGRQRARLQTSLTTNWRGWITDQPEARRAGVHVVAGHA